VDGRRSASTNDAFVVAPVAAAWTRRRVTRPHRVSRRAVTKVPDTVAKPEEHPYHRLVAMIADIYDPGCGADLSPAVALFRSLGDATRLAIVHELARGERRVVDLTRTLALAQSTVSAHIACLRDCGLVEGRPVGRQMLYRLLHAELLSVLGAAEQLLAATGAAVALCPVYGDGESPAAIA
jgi:ArsR family transcriptional regulator, cadmium/lead-responsive transcriptional repressor